MSSYTPMQVELAVETTSVCQPGTSDHCSESCGSWLALSRAASTLYLKYCHTAFSALWPLFSLNIAVFNISMALCTSLE